MIINDLPITGPYEVYDISTGHCIFSWLDSSAPGDIPPDVAMLPVIRSRSAGPVLRIDTKTEVNLYD